MDYYNVTEYEHTRKKYRKGLYVRAKKIFLIVLSILLLVIILSFVFKTKSLKLESKKYYGVYVGSYAGESTASYYANITRMRGGSGGVYADGLQYLVFASVYINQSDAAIVSANLVDADTSAAVYTFELPKVKIVFADGILSLLNDALNLFTEQLESLLKIAVEFDEHNANGSDVIVLVSQMIAEIDSVTKLFEKGKNDGDDSAKYILDAFSRQKTILKQISSNVIKSSDIKIAYFDLLLLNIDLRERFE